MEEKDLLKIFDRHYKRVSKTWTPKAVKGFRTLYRRVWLDGFNYGYGYAEAEMRVKSENLMEKFGI